MSTIILIFIYIQTMLILMLVESDMKYYDGIKFNVLYYEIGVFYSVEL